MPMKKEQLATAITSAITKALDEVFKAESAGGMAEKTPQQLLEASLEPIKDDATKAAILAAVAAMYQAKPPEAPAPSAPMKVDPEKKPEGEVPSLEDDPVEQKKRQKAVDDVLKGLKPEERAVVEAALQDKDAEIAKRQELSDRLATAEEEIAKSTAERELETEIQVSKKFPLVPGDLKKRAGVLLATRKRDPKAYDELVTAFTAANALIAKGKGLDAKGTSRVEGDDGKGNDGESATDQLTRLAKEMYEKAIEKGDTKRTFEQCFSLVTKAHPELLGQSHREIRQ